MSSYAMPAQTASTAAVATAVGSYLLGVYNAAMLAVGTVLHGAVAAVPPDAFVLGADSKIAVAGAIGGLVIHWVQSRNPGFSVEEIAAVKRAAADYRQVAGVVDSGKPAA